MDIAEVSRRSGLPASALRFYEDKGLIRSIGRRGLRRLFSADATFRRLLGAAAAGGQRGRRAIARREKG